MKRTTIIILIILIASNLYCLDNSTDENSNSSITKSNQSTNNSNTTVAKNGWDYYIEGKYQDSIKTLQEEKKYYPERINIYVIMAWDYKFLYNFSAMEQISQEGLKLNPDDARINYNLIEALFNQKKYSEAIPCIEKYISLKYKTNDSTIPVVYGYLGESYYNTNALRKADIALSYARYNSPKDANLILLLANTKEKLKESKKAIDLYNEALKINPANTAAQDGLKRLKNIQQ